MPTRLMILPNKDFNNILLVRMPDDFTEQEAYRHLTGVIAALEERAPIQDRGEVIEALEERGFEVVGHYLGPELCC